MKQEHNPEAASSFVDVLGESQRLFGHQAMLAMLDGSSVMRVITSTYLVPVLIMAPDDKWKEEMSRKLEPCGKPGCTCHVVMSKLMDALDELRTMTMIESDKGIVDKLQEFGASLNTSADKTKGGN